MSRVQVAYILLAIAALLTLFAENILARKSLTLAQCMQGGAKCKYICSNMDRFIGMNGSCVRGKQCCKPVTCPEVGGVCRGAEEQCNNYESRVERVELGCAKGNICCKQNPNEIWRNDNECVYKMRHGQPVFVKHRIRTITKKLAEQYKQFGFPVRRGQQRKAYY